MMIQHALVCVYQQVVAILHHHDQHEEMYVCVFWYHEINCMLCLMRRIQDEKVASCTYSCND